MNVHPPVILEKHRKLIAWLITRLAEFPKDQRFLLADRIQRAMLNIQELLVRAVYKKDRAGLLDEINIQLDVVRLLMRTAQEMKYVNLKRHDYFCRCVNEIGRMVGGWRKAAGGLAMKGNCPERPIGERQSPAEPTRFCQQAERKRPGGAGSEGAATCQVRSVCPEPPKCEPLRGELAAECQTRSVCPETRVPAVTAAGSGAVKGEVQTP
jgi:hypothetical protein